MLTHQHAYTLALLAILAVAAPAPAPQLSSSAIATGAGSSQYSSASSQYSSILNSITPTVSASGAVPSLDSQVEASIAVPTIAAPPLRSSQVTGVTSHGPYTGTAITTGAPQSGPAASSIPALGPNPTATYYNADGGLTQEEPAPYTPAGGLGTNGTLPRYMVESDFDFESIVLGLYQEWIELDLFHNGLAVFSDDDFANAGLTPADRSYIEFMADQEAGHATLLSNMLGEAAPPQCTYDYPFTTVREWLDFNQRLTAWGEAGVWGFINHLDSREVGQLLAQSIATESRQQMSFRQLSGQFPQPVWFEAGIPQSWAWTYLAPYISSCPADTTRLAWQNFPALHVVNNANINRISPNDTLDNEVTGNRTSDPSNSTIPTSTSCQYANTTGDSCTPAIANNRSEPLSFPGKKIYFQWDSPGQPVGPNNSYVTSTSAGKPTHVAWVSQLNLTYSDLTVTGNNSGFTFQPAGFVFGTDGIINQTTFVALTDTSETYTAFNLSMINPHVSALGLLMAG